MTDHVSVKALTDEGIAGMVQIVYAAELLGRKIGVPVYVAYEIIVRSTMAMGESQVRPPTTSIDAEMIKRLMDHASTMVQ